MRLRRRKARRQVDLGHDGQQERKQRGGFSGNGIRQSRFRVNPGLWKTADGRGSSRVSFGYRGGATILRGRSTFWKPHQSDAFNRKDYCGQQTVISSGREEDIAATSLKRFATFYFTNFPPQLSNFYLRKGFEVCGIHEDVVVPSRRNLRGEYYGFVKFSQVRDVGKLLKAVNAVWFGNFRVNARLARFDRSVDRVEDEKDEGDHVGVGKEISTSVMREQVGEGDKSVSLGKEISTFVLI